MSHKLCEYLAESGERCGKLPMNGKTHCEKHTGDRYSDGEAKLPSPVESKEIELSSDKARRAITKKPLNSIENLASFLDLMIRQTAAGYVPPNVLSSISSACSVQKSLLETVEVVRKIEEIEGIVYGTGQIRDLTYDVG